MLIIVVALDCEARPLIQNLKCQRCHSFKAFPLYRGEDVLLGVSGIGSRKALLCTAAMAGFCLSQRFDQDLVLNKLAFLNVGVAGHKTRAIGSGLLAHKVSNNAQSFYPVWPDTWPCDTAEVSTVDSPVTDYLDTVVEMEALGFLEAAARFTSVELAHVYKVISDNERHSVDQIDKELVSSLVSDQLPQIENIVNVLKATLAELDGLAKLPDDYNLLLNHYRVSVSQKNQLMRLLRRWQTLADSVLLDTIKLDQYKTIQQWLKAANEHLVRLPVSI